MVNLVRSTVACVSVWYEATPPPPVFCHAAADFGMKRRRASLRPRQPQFNFIRNSREKGFVS